MDTFRKTLKITALGLGLAALTTFGANAQNYNNGYNNDSRYNNNGNYNDQNSYDDGDEYDASYQDFYDDLAPYGEWINDPDYGYVWVPDVSRDFRPYYTNGYWAQTEYGNTWVSNYDWGWATFHYGRWTYDNSYGWVWIPGNEWAPAWVNWRSADDGYYGWAPMGPGYDLDYYASNESYYGPSAWWVFAPQQYLYSNNFRNYVRAPRYNNDYLRRSRFVNVSQRANGYRYFAGPRRGDVERAIGRTIPTYRITDTRRAGGTRVVGNSGISMYRPRISSPRSNTNTATNQPFRPQSFRQGRLNIQEGGARMAPNTLQNNTGVRQMPQQGNPRMNGRPGERPQGNVPANNDQMRMQRAQQEQNTRVERDQQVRPQGQQRVQQAQQQNEQRQRDLQFRQQEEQQRNQAQQQQEIRQREQQGRMQQDQQRTLQMQQQQQVRQQQEQQRAQQVQQQQQIRQQQDQQRAQQMQQQQQIRQQQEQQRAQQQQQQQQVREQQRQVREAQPVREQRIERAQPQAQPQQIQEQRPVRQGGEGFRRR